MFFNEEEMQLTHRARHEFGGMEDWDATILNALCMMRWGIRRINEALYWHDSSFHDVEELYELAPAIDAAIAGYVENRLYTWAEEIEELKPTEMPKTEGTP